MFNWVSGSIGLYNHFERGNHGGGFNPQAATFCTVFKNNRFGQYGNEQFIGMEIRAFLNYWRKGAELSYWRSTHGYEVDFLIGQEIAVEIKASQKITKRDFKGLKALKEEGVFKKYILVSQDPINTSDGNVTAVYWKKFLDDLWSDRIV